MALPEPLRGEVWDVRFPSFGEHPAVIISANPPNRQLGHVAAIPITGTAGPGQTQVVLTADAGLTRYAQSYADVTGLQATSRSRLLRRRGLLDPAELARIERQLRVYLRL